MQEPVSLYAKSISAAWIFVALMCLGFFGRDWISALQGEAALPVLVISTVAVVIAGVTLGSAIAMLLIPRVANLNVLVIGSILAATYGLAYLLLVGIEFGIAPAILNALLVVLGGATFQLRRMWRPPLVGGKAGSDTATTQ